MIEPTLGVIGYDPLDLMAVREQVPVLAAGRSQGSGFADYVLFAQARAIAIVEAKELRTDRKLLEDPASIQQVFTYCERHDAHPRPRWGVITNGRYWCIYDTAASGTLFERKLLDIDVLRAPELLLSLAPSFEAQLSAHADAMAAARRADILIREAATESLNRRLREQCLARWLPLTAAAPIDPTLPLPVAAVESGKAGGNGRTAVRSTVVPLRVARPQPPSPPSVVSSGPGLTASFRVSPQAHGKPTSVTVRGAATRASSWSQVLSAVAENLLSRDKLSVPFQTPRSSRVLIAADRVGMIRPMRLSSGVFLEANWSASDCVRLAGELFRGVGEDPDQFTVQYIIGKPRRSSEPE